MLRKLINEIFNYETFSKSLLSSIGYGLGFIIPTHLKLNSFICIIICLVVGTIFDKLADYIMTSDIFTGNIGNRIITTGVVYIIYLVVWVAFDYFLDYDLDYDFISDIIFVIAFQIIALLVDRIKKYINKKFSKTS